MRRAIQFTIYDLLPHVRYTIKKPGIALRVLILTLCIAHCASSSVIAQETKVNGRVFDPLTNEPIPFANVVFKSTTTGTTSDIDGNYKLETMEKADSIMASLVGYIPVTMPVLSGKSQVINFALRLNKFDIPEVEIKAGENPADIIMRQVIANKDENNRSHVNSYQYETYNKLEFDINNITEKFKNKKLFKPFKFIFENVDSTATNKKPFLPIFLTETLSDVYFTKDPKRKMEVIKASKISGLQNNTISKYLGDFYQNLNVYDNYIYLFGKGFISPLAGISSVYYKYYLLDSSFIGDQWCYKLKFKPRLKHELTFTGEVWIHDTTFAVKKISMRITEDANINFIEDLAFVDEYSFIDKKQWMLTRDLLVVNIAPTESQSKQTMGFIARKSTTYKNFVLDQPKPDSFFKAGEEVIVEKDASKKDEAFWQEARHDSLTATEKKIYAMVDTIETLPAFKTYVDVIRVFATGYKDVGMFEIGEIGSLYSINNLEGNRFKLAFRTNNKFSKSIQFSGYGAYGTRDDKFKYGAGFEYFIPDKKYSSFGASYKYDVEQLGKSISSLNSDNFVLNILSRIQSNQYNKLTQEQVFYETDILKGLTANISFYHRELIPLNNFDFSYYADDTRSDLKNTLTTSEVMISFRFAYKERFIESGRKGAVGLKSTRIALGSKYPIQQIIYVRGIKDLWGSDFMYHKLRYSVSDVVRFGNFGNIFLLAEVGKVWGTIPYPILEVHKGNETYTYNPDLFNMMNYIEFVSDEFASASATQHFGGILLNRIPLIRKLKWREVATARFLVGRISQANRDILYDPTVFYSLSTPYFEAGIGVENIFKIARVDLIRRFTYLDHPNIAKTGVRVSLSLSF